MQQALQVAHAWQMLHSKNPAIVAVAKAQVCQIARKRYRLIKYHWTGRGDELIRYFLNSEFASPSHATAHRRSGNVASLWVDVQRVLKVHHLTFHDRADESCQDPFSLRVPHHTHWLYHKSVLRHV
uniref:Transposase n=1 Tax=Peronospora matthiolae TaxID=2874970 RepID=A0AAV1U799_9STRA